jgi:hypothetical protein
MMGARLLKAHDVIRVASSWVQYCSKHTILFEWHQQDKYCVMRVSRHVKSYYKIPATTVDAQADPLKAAPPPTHPLDGTQPVRRRHMRASRSFLGHAVSFHSPFIACMPLAGHLKGDKHRPRLWMRGQTL